MKRREYLTAAAGVAATSTLGLAGCIGTAEATGTLATRVSDRPGDIDDFQTCVVHISGVWVKPSDGGLEKHDVDDATADLTELQGEKSALVEELELDAGEYEYLQLQVSETDATLADGSDANVQVPGSAPLKFEKSFEIRSGETTTFTADFTPVKAGKSGKYLLQPVADEVTVSYEEETTTSNATATTSPTPQP